MLEILAPIHPILEPQPTFRLRILNEMVCKSLKFSMPQVMIKLFLEKFKYAQN
jgi:hypothetical protein